MYLYPLAFAVVVAPSLTPEGYNLILLFLFL